MEITKSVDKIKSRLDNDRIVEVGNNKQFEESVIEKINNIKEEIEEFDKRCNSIIDEYQEIYVRPDTTEVFLNVLQSICNLCRTYIKSLIGMGKEYNIFIAKNASLKDNKDYGNWVKTTLYALHIIKKDFNTLSSKSQTYFDALKREVDALENN